MTLPKVMILLVVAVFCGLAQAAGDKPTSDIPDVLLTEDGGKQTIAIGDAMGLSCESLIANAALYLQDTNRHVVGLLKDFMHVLNLAGVSELSIRILVSALDNILDANSQIPAVSRVATDLHMQLEEGLRSSTQNILPICMGGTGCIINNKRVEPIPSSFANSKPSNDAAYIAKHINFKIEKFDPSVDGFVKLSQQQIQAMAGLQLQSKEILYVRPFELQGLDGTSLAIKEGQITGNISRIAGVKFAIWMGQFVRELAKHSTFTILNEWFSANMARLEANASADELFAKYVGFKNDKIIISDEFLWLLIYSRSAAAWTEAEAIIFREFIGTDAPVQTAIAQQNAGHRSGTVKDLMAKVGQDFIRREGVTNDNILEIGDRYINTMQATISRRNN